MNYAVNLFSKKVCAIVVALAMVIGLAAPFAVYASDYDIVPPLPETVEASYAPQPLSSPGELIWHLDNDTVLNHWYNFGHGGHQGTITVERVANIYEDSIAGLRISTTDNDGHFEIQIPIWANFTALALEPDREYLVTGVTRVTGITPAYSVYAAMWHRNSHGGFGSVYYPMNPLPMGNDWTPFSFPVTTRPDHYASGDNGGFMLHGFHLYSPGAFYFADMRVYDVTSSTVVPCDECNLPPDDCICPNINYVPGNIFNNGDANVANSFNAGNWVSSNHIYVEAGSTPHFDTVRVPWDGNGSFNIPMIEGHTYDIRVFARGNGIINFTGVHVFDVFDNDWGWRTTTATVPASSSGTLNATDVLVQLSARGNLWVESIIVIDLTNLNAQLTVDTSTTFQTIEGFGFFGAHDVWWSPTRFDTPEAIAWIDTILIDMGITMWRNEPYPFVPPWSLYASNPQDSNWDEQKYFVKALHDRAVELGIPLRIILTVWSPPGEWKTSGTTRNPPYPEPNHLMPQYYETYAYWLVEVLEMYRDIGIEVYAVSPQNEPAFGWQGYNSSFYSARTYVEMLNVVAPIVTNYFPDVYIFGAEAMLEHEYLSFSSWHHPAMQFHRGILGLIPGWPGATPEAMQNFVFAHHGYADGIVATSPDVLDHLWRAERQLIGPNHRLWMTETSGYHHVWEDIGPNSPGALSLAAAIQSALIHGDVSAWVYWQGQQASTTTPHYHALMNLERGWPMYKFTASQHFYRYIRPGAVRVDSQIIGLGTEGLAASAFVHDELDSTTIVVVNATASGFDLDLVGIPSGMDFEILLSDGSQETIRSGGTLYYGDPLNVPPLSIITLINNEYREPAPGLTQDDMDQRDVDMAVRALERAGITEGTYTVASPLARTQAEALGVSEDFVGRWAFYLDWEIVGPFEFTPAIDQTPTEAPEYGYFNFHVRVSQGNFEATTLQLTLHISPVKSGDGELIIDLTTRFQVFEAIGFNGTPTGGINDAWLEAAFDRLGANLWALNIQSGFNWEATRSLVEDVVAHLDAHDETLRLFLTVHPHLGGLGTPAAFANWLVETIDLFESTGALVYAVSLQHEPIPWEIGGGAGYANLLNAVAPTVLAAHPGVRIVGPQTIGFFEGPDGVGWGQMIPDILANSTAVSNLSAVTLSNGPFGPALGTVMSGGTAHWRLMRNNIAPSGLPVWTGRFHTHEDSGVWHSIGANQGALLLAQEIQLSLYYGHATAWVADSFSTLLTLAGDGVATNESFDAINHFSRFIRPGAQRVSAVHDLDDDPNLRITAWRHDEMDNYVIVIVNPDAASFELNITGAGLPDAFDKFLSTGGSNNMQLVGQVSSLVEIPANSVITLVYGDVGICTSPTCDVCNPVACDCDDPCECPDCDCDCADCNELPPSCLGDVNRDGVVDIDDMLLILQYINGEITADDLCIVAADLDHNGVIDFIDLMWIEFLILQFFSPQDLGCTCHECNPPDDDSARSFAPMSASGFQTLLAQGALRNSVLASLVGSGLKHRVY